MEDFFKVALKKYKSARQIAIALEITPQALKKYKDGDRSPSLYTLQNWCDKLDITFNYSFTAKK